MMIEHNLVQGTQEWLAHRKNYLNASDAPSMLGLSKYKTRTQLLNELSTGIVPEVSSFTQKIFNDGHRFEALARPIAELKIGDDLYAKTGSLGRLSASFDGITEDGTVIFEHKTLNDEIRSCLTIDDLDLMYKVQMEHQLMVSGAAMCLFMASIWDKDNNLTEDIKSLWYKPDLELRKQIVDAWAQFDLDLADFVPEAIVEKIKAQPIIALPSLAIQIKGEVLLSNLSEFKTASTAFIATIKTELITDEDFAQAEANEKFCKEAEDNIEQTKKSAIAQTSSIDELMRTLDFISAQLREKRLLIGKLVVNEKANRKTNIVNFTKEAFKSHLDELNKSIAPLLIPNLFPDFFSATKNKRTLTSMKESVDLMLAEEKSKVNVIAQEYGIKKEWFDSYAHAFKFLFSDLNSLISKQFDDFKAVVNNRINEHEKLEAEKEAANNKPIVFIDKPLNVKAEVLKLSGEMKEINIGEVKPMPTEYTPSPIQLVYAIAEKFDVTRARAYMWLVETDFLNLKV